MVSVYKEKGSRNYKAEWRDENGKRRRKSTKTTDEIAARAIAEKWEADAALKREGVQLTQKQNRIREQRRESKSSCNQHHLMGVSTVSQMLSISEEKLNSLVSTNRIAHTKLDGMVVFRPEHLKSFLYKNRQEASK